jgi:hypothetical protein
MAQVITQGSVIREAMLRLMSNGMTDKDDIYDHCEKVMNFPRPTVRRVARDLRAELKKQYDILSSDIGKNGSS